MAIKLYVGKLAYTTTEDQVKALFAEFGEVKSTMLIKDRDSGESKGFAFVEMDDDTQAEAAMAALNGKDVDNRAIVVNVAKPREVR